MSQIYVRAITPEDARWVTSFLVEHWNATVIASRGQLINASELPGFLAKVGGEPVGLLTYQINNDQCEVVTLNSLREGMGVGTALLECAVQAARKEGCC